MWALLLSAGKFIQSLPALFKELRSIYYQQKFGKLHDVVSEVEQKKVDGVLTDDDIIDAAKKLRKHKKGLFP